MIRFLQTGDWQLGMSRIFLDDAAQNRFDDARLGAILRLGEVAAERHCAFVLVCGDVFESNQIDRRTVARAVDALRQVPVPVYLLPGNHDPLDPLTIYRQAAFTAKCPDHVHVLDSSEPRAPAPGVELIGVPWRSKRPTRDPVAAVLETLEPAGDTVRVVAAHGAVDTFVPRPDAATIRLQPVREALAEGRIHHLALGDRHSATEVVPRVTYAGTPEQTDFDEIAPGFVLEVAVTPRASEVTRHAVGTWRFEKTTYPLQGAEDVDELADHLRDYPHKDRTVLRLVLEGALPVAGHRRLQAILEDARAAFAALDLPEIDETVALVPDADELSELALSPYAAEALDVLTRAIEAGGEDARTAAAARSLLFRLLEQPA